MRAPRPSSASAATRSNAQQRAGSTIAAVDEPARVKVATMALAIPWFADISRMAS
jgi:hypothetical protein